MHPITGFECFVATTPASVCTQSNITIVNKYIGLQRAADFLLSVIGYQWLYIRLLNYFVRSTFDGMIRKTKSWQSPRAPGLNCQRSQPLSYDNQPSVSVPVLVLILLSPFLFLSHLLYVLHRWYWQWPTPSRHLNTNNFFFSWNSHRIWPSFVTLAGFCAGKFWVVVETRVRLIMNI